MQMVGGTDGYWFTSSLFSIESGEDEDCNPGRYGRQLALWLKSQLEQRGYAVEPVMAEDWGRCLMLSRDPFALWVGCGNVAVPGADHPPGDVVWHCFAAAEVPLRKRFFGKPDTAGALSKLDADLQALLGAEPAITRVAVP